MKIPELYRPGELALSFELFPPKTEKGEAALVRHVRELMAFDPVMITCTYGAGGSTRDKTLEIASGVRREFGVSVASHLTCVGSTADELRAYLREAAAAGIENIVALRGDPPQGETEFVATQGGFDYANELVAMIAAEFDFGIAVGGYPEKHQEAPSLEVDIENLKRKVDAGSDLIITQLFYDNADYFRFADLCEQAGVDVPLVPGLMPITNFAQIQRITALCGAKLPGELVSRLEAAGDDAEAQLEIGCEFAARQVQGLLDGGVAGLHFYVLNKSHATSRVLNAVTLPG